jgi:hypothetical protein
MIRLTILTISLTICSFVNGQDCMTFQEYSSNGEKVSDLDSLYPTAINIDTTIAVFHGRMPEFYEAWASLLKDFGKYLSAHDFEWNKSTHCFNKVYFSKDGTIDKFLFNFKPGAIDKEKQVEFGKLLNSFTKDYKLKINSAADKDFSQCGGVNYGSKD